ncbi:hypothetical protein EHF33_06000 [Deinococcus psychrotolerans]|uniref:HTH iclR-type domain-containing protein n=1 Tax=Deinococcus psychrotolerans TaxID=2489213 RepID=A0A3G8YAF9_9DEIO|nr:hypothetical protein [Deinococcus psychrotolerans]AZI42359.1 hypothetical protein EHF33_06000 [Deinococcus psychrotolerans]
MEKVFRATTSAQARLLLSLRAASVLGALLGESEGQTAAEIACKIEQPLSGVHRILGQLLAAELITVMGTRPRAGRPCKLYAARAAGYEVPFALSDAATLHEMMGAHYRPFFEAFLHHQARLLTQQRRDMLRLGMRDGQLNYSFVEPDFDRFRSEIYGLFAAMSLSAEQADTLQAELRSLGEKYSRHDAQGKPYLLGLLFSPGTLES